MNTYLPWSEAWQNTDILWPPDCAPRQSYGTNCIDSPPCRHQLGSQYTNIENVHYCTRVCASGILCPGVVQKCTHSRLVDVSLSADLRTITGCLCPTQVEQLPVLAEIAPPALRREAATLVLGRRVCQHDRLLHNVMENSTHRKRLKSRRPVTHHAQQLVSSVHPQETVKHWSHARYAESWASTTTRLHQFMPTPSNSEQCVGLSRRSWTRLNRLRTGVGRFGANMLRWGLSTSDCCDCGAEQMADQITSGRCPNHRTPEGMHGLIELDVKTRTWLENSALDVWVVCDGTREKKNISLSLPLGRDLSIRVFRTDFATLSSSLRCTWPNHDSRFFIRKVFIGFMCAFSCMIKFLMWSFLVFPCIHLSIFISVVFIWFCSHFLIIPVAVIIHQQLNTCIHSLRHASTA